MIDVSWLKGSITPIVTPFKDGAVDYDTYARLVDWQIVNGGHGILVNGTTAEPSLLTVAERNRLVDVALEATNKRVPVLAATGSQSHAETVELTAHADKAGVAGLLVVTPYYVRPPQRGLIAYYTDICQRTELPVLIYHIPGRAAVSTDLATVKAMKEAIPNLVGMKHAVNDMGFVTHMLDTFGPQWLVFVGLEELSFPMLAVGACGLMNAVGNLAPRKVALLFEAVERGDLHAARKLHFDLFDLNLSVFYDTNPIPIKYMMKRMGLLKSNEHRLPMMPATRELELRLDAVLTRAGLLVSASIPRLEMGELRAELADYLAPRVKRLGYLGELFKCAGNAPDVTLQFMHFTDALKEALPDRLTELGALTVASFMENRYERHQHERLSVKLGFPKEWVAQVYQLDPDAASQLSDLEKAAQRYALKALHTRGLDTGKEFEAFAALVPPSEAMAFVLLIGRYVTHAMVVNTLKLAPPVPSIFE